MTNCQLAQASQMHIKRERSAKE